VNRNFLRADELVPIVKDHKSQNRKIVFTNGVFDLIHLGHVTYLLKAKSLGDILIVGINTDSSVQRIKGPLKPIIPLEERAEMLLALSCVDYVSFFDEDTPLKIIQCLQPDILVKGGDWTVDKIVGADLVKGWGGEVHTITIVEGRSTTNLIQLIRDRYAHC
jgi:D-beta-D-heptose 7-phosphate kinase/D-beta-D-heptose 1-phosphate adenosyltransferase